ncbi:MAG: type II toxin-antitoxin system prevent-host-death family antitoxin [Rhodocyclaceae bacterium]|nr:type II toxin-antitoxin system prevent-host-death family antitoxin [Rhodocyclaceae bacterium]
MRTVPVVEAKAKFSALLAEVAQGGEIAITRHGHVVARLVPEEPRMAADAFRMFWEEGGAVDLEAPIDRLPEPVAPLD